jgi:hypothetical protein
MLEPWAKIGQRLRRYLTEYYRPLALLDTCGADTYTPSLALRVAGRRNVRVLLSFWEI